MLGRCQQALYRGVLAGLLKQQHCLQLEVCLGFQAVRGKKGATKGKLTFKSVREQQRQERAFNLAMDQLKGSPDASDTFAVPAASLLTQSSSTAAAANTGTADSSASSGRSSSGPVNSPLSAQLPSGNSMSGVVSSSALLDQGGGAAAAAANAGGKPAGWSSWVRNLFEKPRRRLAPPAPPGSTSPLQQAAPANEGSSRAAGDGWEELDHLKDLSLDQYHGLIKNDPQAGEDPELPPRPQVPPRGPQAFAQSQLDKARVMFARYEQQSALITLMEPELKLKVKQDPAGALRSPAFLAHIAHSTNTDLSVVRDTIYCYSLRKEFLDLLNAYRESGKQMPQMTDNDKQQELVDYLKAQKKQKEWEELRRNRDPKNCELKSLGRLVSPRAKCSRTNLQYADCCGARQQPLREFVL